MSVLQSLCVFLSSALPLTLFLTHSTAAPSLEGDPFEAREVSHQQSLTLHPSWLEVVETHAFEAASGSSPTTLLYRFELPAAAVLIGLDVTLNGKRHKAISVDAIAAVRPAPSAGKRQPDIALVRLVEVRDGRAFYDLVLHPVGQARPVFASIRWQQPTTIEAGYVTSDLVMRGGKVRAKLGRSSLRLTDFRIDGTAVRNGVAKSASVARRVRVRAKIAGQRRNHFEYAPVRLAPDLWAVTVAFVSRPPRVVFKAFDTLIVVIDVSRSMGESGKRAAGKVVSEILQSSPSSQIEVIFFDRTARRVFGSLRENTASARGNVDTALAQATLANGSDLRAGLFQASLAFAEADARDRTAGVVVISDGKQSRATDTALLTSALGEDRVKRMTLFTVDITGESASAAVPVGGALRPLVIASGGRHFGLRTSASQTEIERIAPLLAPGHTLANVALEFDGIRQASMAIPTQIGRGSGFVDVSLWRGEAPPKRVVLRGSRGGDVTLTARKRQTGLSSYGAALAFRDQAPTELNDIEAAEGGVLNARGEAVTTKRALASIGESTPVVTRFNTLVVPGADSFSQARRAFAKKWGTELYQRAATPSERIERTLGASSRNLKAKPVRIGGAAQTPPLDRQVLKTAIRGQLYKPIRHCYEKALRKNRAVAGTVRVDFEIAVGEVVKARVIASGLPSNLRRCVLDSAYLLNVPPMSRGDDTTYVVRYPFKLKPRKTGGEIEPGRSSVDPNDPLDQLR